MHFRAFRFARPPLAFFQAPLTKAQKKAAKKKANDVNVKAAKSEALKKARIARVRPQPLFCVSVAHLLSSLLHDSTIPMSLGLFPKFKLQKPRLIRRARREPRMIRTTRSGRMLPKSIRMMMMRRRIRPTIPILPIRMMRRLPFPFYASINLRMDPLLPSPNCARSCSNESPTFKRTSVGLEPSPRKVK